MMPHCGSKSWVSGCLDRKSTRLNSSHLVISYAVFCLKKKKKDCELRYSREDIHNQLHRLRGGRLYCLTEIPCHEAHYCRQSSVETWRRLCGSRHRQVS